ncbi:MAG: type I secretion system permease/ATPase, partial [Gammaproteobacteria bacterium]|nr:type I secretion system permease/ATPase [Gammaproteobacteria bacterium]
SSRKPTINNSFLKSCIEIQRKKIVAVIVFSLAVNLLNLTIPLYLLQIFNRVIPSQSADTLIFLTTIVIFCLLTMTLLEGTRHKVLAQLGAWLDRRLGGLVLSGSIARSVEKSRPSSAQGLRDLATIRRLFSNGAIFPILDIPWTPIFLLVLFMLHPLIGTITLLGALTLFAVAYYHDLTTRSLSARADDASTNSLRYASSVLRNSDAIQAMGMRSGVISTWDKKHARSVTLQDEFQAQNNRAASISRFIRVMMHVAVIGSAGWLVLNDALTAGALIASALLMRRAVAPVERAISTWKVVQSARSAFKNIDRRLSLAPEFENKPPLPLPSGYLSVRNVSYAYSNSSSATLQGVTMKVHPGEVVGLTGNTAAGKSTLGRLIVGLCKPDDGYIKLDGIDVSRWKSEDIGALIGYLPQSSELFAGTVEENIARMGEVDDAEVIKAARLAAVHDMILQFPQAYKTNIGEEGSFLSAGQRQRIALARAIYKSPKLLVLDEPDANLDVEGKIALASAIEIMKSRGAIIVFISHQEKVLRFADNVLRLRKGKVTMDVKFKRTGNNSTKSSSSTESGSSRPVKKAL